MMLDNEFDELLTEIIHRFLITREDAIYNVNETERGYLSEQDISKRLQANPNSAESIIYAYLWRVQRYFLISFGDKTLPIVDRKEQTLAKTKQFVGNWATHMPEVQSFFYQNKQALNLLMLGLFLTDDKSVWDDCLSIISPSLEKTSPLELSLIQWCYEFFFSDKPSSDEAFWHEFHQLGPNISELSTGLPFQLFQFVVLCRFFRDNPLQTPYTTFPGLLVERRAFSPHLITLALLLQSSTIMFWTWKNNARILAITQPMGLNFLSHFRLDIALPIPEIYLTGTIPLLIEKLILSYISNLHIIQEKEQALGIFELWRCSRNHEGLYRTDIRDFVHFAHRLFSMGCYKEAYQVYFSLISSVIVKGDVNVIQAKLSMYSLAMFIESWLVKPEHSTKKLRDKIKSFSRYLCDVPKYFKNEVEHYKASITQLLKTVILFVNSPEGRAFVDMAPFFIDEWSALLLKEERNKLKKAIHPVKPKATVKKPLPAVIPKALVLETPIPPPGTTSTPRGSSAGPIPLSFFQEHRHIIHQKYLPKTLMLLVATLQQTHPKALFYLTGGAVLDLLSNIPPNDYDLVMFGLTFDELTKTLCKMGIKHHKIGQNHPIVTCKVTAHSHSTSRGVEADKPRGVDDEVSIDFSCLPAIEEACAMDCLREDFPTRLFNVSALYVKLTDDTILPIFSFSGALSSRNQRLITANSDAATLFKEKPWALIRLIFVQMKYPNYKISHALTEARSNIDKTWLGGFKDYDAYFTACFAKLLSRFPFKACNQSLQSFGLLTVLTGLTIQECNAAIALIKHDIPDEKKYCYWLYALTLYAIKEKGITEPLPIARVLCLSKTDRKNLSFIHSQIPDYPFVATEDETIKEWVSELFPDSPYCDTYALSSRTK